MSEDEYPALDAPEQKPQTEATPEPEWTGPPPEDAPPEDFTEPEPATPRPPPQSDPFNRDARPSFSQSSDPFFEKGLPNDQDIERIVLGAILLREALLYDVMARVKEPRRIFFLDSHRRIIDKMIILIEKQVPIELPTLCGELRTAGELEQIGGPVYISSLIDGVPRTDFIGHYLDILIEKTASRNEITLFNEGIARVFEGEETPYAIAESVHLQLFSLIEDQQGGGPNLFSLEQELPGVIEVLEQRAGHPEMITGVPTGLTDVDRLTAGLHKQELTLIAARPSIG
jgi:replicative DNA helicase